MKTFRYLAAATAMTTSTILLPLLHGEASGTAYPELAPAEAPEMVFPRLQTSSTMIVNDEPAPPVTPARVDQPGSPADDPGPNTDPAISAPNTVDINGVPVSYVPEGTEGCYATIQEYLDEWHNTGEQPIGPCFQVPDNQS